MSGKGRRGLGRALFRQSIVIEASIILPLTIEFKNLIVIIIVSNSERKEGFMIETI